MTTKHFTITGDYLTVEAIMRELRYLVMVLAEIEFAAPAGLVRKEVVYCE